MSSSPAPQPFPSPKAQALILAAAWCLLHAVLFYQFGIVTSLEAHKYIEQAESLVQTGSYTSPNFLFYSTEILLIAAAKSLHTGYGPVVAIQLAFNALSTYCFYRTIERLTGKKTVAFFFTLAFTGMFYYQLYNVHLFTESLYFSFSVIFFYRLTGFKSLRFPQVLEIGLLLCLLYFTRPVGLFFLPATFVYLVLRFYRKRASTLFLTTGLLLLGLFVLLLNASMSAGGEFNFLLPYLEGQVICGVSSANRYRLVIPVEQNSVQGLFYLVTHYPGLFFSLFTKRLLAFFGALRSYYSLPHNVFIALYFYSIYLLAILGLKKNAKGKTAEAAFLIFVILITALTAGLACDEWHNRFLYAVFPFLLFLASLAFAGRESSTRRYQ